MIRYRCPPRIDGTHLFRRVSGNVDTYFHSSHAAVHTARSHYPHSPLVIASAISKSLSGLRFIHHHERTPVTKVCPDARTALDLSGLKSGDTIAVGGFGLGGIPETLLNEISNQESGPSSLTVISLTAGVDSFGLGRLFEAGKVKRMISSYVGENKVRACIIIIVYIALFAYRKRGCMFSDKCILIIVNTEL